MPGAGARAVVALLGLGGAASALRAAPAPRLTPAPRARAAALCLDDPCTVQLGEAERERRKGEAVSRAAPAPEPELLLRGVQRAAAVAAVSLAMLALVLPLATDFWLAADGATPLPPAPLLTMGSAPS